MITEAPLPDALKPPKKGQESPRVELVEIPNERLEKSVQTIQGLSPYLGTYIPRISPHTLSVVPLKKVLVQSRRKRQGYGGAVDVGLRFRSALYSRTCANILGSFLSRN